MIKDHSIFTKLSQQNTYRYNNNTQSLPNMLTLIIIIICKANSVRAFLQRNLNQCSLHVKSLEYFTYVKPILEYIAMLQ